MIAVFCLALVKHIQCVYNLSGFAEVEIFSLLWRLTCYNNFSQPFCKISRYILVVASVLYLWFWASVALLPEKLPQIDSLQIVQLRYYLKSSSGRVSHISIGTRSASLIIPIKNPYD